MGGIWETIDSARYASGRLWHPSLSLDMMARDWAGVTLPLNVYIDVAGHGGAYDVWEDWFELALFLPPSWDGDGTFDDMQILISIQLKMQYNLPGHKVRIEDGDQEATITSGWVWHTLTKTLTTWASGKHVLNIQAKDTTGSGDVDLATMTPADGPRAFFQVQRQ